MKYFISIGSLLCLILLLSVCIIVPLKVGYGNKKNTEPRNTFKTDNGVVGINANTHYLSSLDSFGSNEDQKRPYAVHSDGIIQNASERNIHSDSTILPIIENDTIISDPTLSSYDLAFYIHSIYTTLSKEKLFFIGTVIVIGVIVKKIIISLIQWIYFEEDEVLQMNESLFSHKMHKKIGLFFNMTPFGVISIILLVAAFVITRHLIRIASNNDIYVNANADHATNDDIHLKKIVVVETIGQGNSSVMHHLNSNTNTSNSIINDNNFNNTTSKTNTTRNNTNKDSTGLNCSNSFFKLTNEKKIFLPNSQKNNVSLSSNRCSNPETSKVKSVQSIISPTTSLNITDIKNIGNSGFFSLGDAHWNGSLLKNCFLSLFLFLNNAARIFRCGIFTFTNIFIVISPLMIFVAIFSNTSIAKQNENTSIIKQNELDQTRELLLSEFSNINMTACQKTCEAIKKLLGTDDDFILSLLLEHTSRENIPSFITEMNNIIFTNIIVRSLEKNFSQWNRTHVFLIWKAIPSKDKNLSLISVFFTFFTKCETPKSMDENMVSDKSFQALYPDGFLAALSAFLPDIDATYTINENGYQTVADLIVDIDYLGIAFDVKFVQVFISNIGKTFDIKFSHWVKFLQAFDHSVESLEASCKLARNFLTESDTTNENIAKIITELLSRYSYNALEDQTSTSIGFDSFDVLDVVCEFINCTSFSWYLNETFNQLSISCRTFDVNPRYYFPNFYTLALFTSFLYFIEKHEKMADIIKKFLPFIYANNCIYNEALRVIIKSGGWLPYYINTNTGFSFEALLNIPEDHSIESLLKALLYVFVCLEKKNDLQSITPMHPGDNKKLPPITSWIEKSQWEKNFSQLSLSKCTLCNPGTPLGCKWLERFNRAFSISFIKKRYTNPIVLFLSIYRHYFVNFSKITSGSPTFKDHTTYIYSFRNMIILLYSLDANLSDLNIKAIVSKLFDKEFLDQRELQDIEDWYYAIFQSNQHHGIATSPPID